MYYLYVRILLVRKYPRLFFCSFELKVESKKILLIVTGGLKRYFRTVPGTVTVRYITGSFMFQYEFWSWTNFGLETSPLNATIVPYRTKLLVHSRY